MKVLLLVLAILFGLLGIDEAITLNEHAITAYAFPSLLLAAIFLVGFAIVDAIDRSSKKG